MLASRIFSLDINFRNSLKLAIVAMIPPVLLDLMYGIMDKGISASFLSYMGVYALSMAILLVDLIQNPDSTDDIDSIS